MCQPSGRQNWAWDQKEKQMWRHFYILYFNDIIDYVFYFNDIIDYVFMGLECAVLVVIFPFLDYLKTIFSKRLCFYHYP